MFQENWHFRSCLVLKTTKTKLLVLLLRFFEKLIDVIIDDLVFYVVKILRLCRLTKVDGQREK